jgi:hypothetical protein
MSNAELIESLERAGADCRRKLDQARADVERLESVVNGIENLIATLRRDEPAPAVQTASVEVTAPPRPRSTGTITDRAVEALAAGPLTAAEIAERIGSTPASVDTTLGAAARKGERVRKLGPGRYDLIDRKPRHKLEHAKGGGWECSECGEERPTRNEFASLECA